ncbi:hypothetical protein DZF91_21590 [Actinomadura logoneensis]|uniref:Uncharacterized protein n=1 Tax=Actinomadura logoneensis TaxID=2293572 RepID=A0A372JHZ7_9ACTN|nr:hypothetical protein [Actinomadura logoneensis]RFU39580.1 hypothetical protein DZF91_21590 [Actinomadura logoneensis]
MSRSHRPGSPPRTAALRRRLGWDANPLRRDVDRRQRLVGLALLVLFLLVAPVTGLRVGAAAYDRGVRTELAEAATWQPVSAVVTGLADRKHGDRVDVVGTAADGHRFVGSYTTARVVAVGDHVKLWATPVRLTDNPPRRHVRTVTDTVLTVAVSLLAVAAGPVLVHVLFRRRCDRVRSRLWDTAWVRLDHRTNH